jgi:hypothetical protein
MPTSWPLILPWLVTVVLAAALWQYPALGWGLMAASTAALERWPRSFEHEPGVR